MSDRKKLFPEYLNVGSRGGAVKALQHMLMFGNYNFRIVPNGNYRQETVLGVSTLQRALGFQGKQIDGNFGPETRAALKSQRGIDINEIYVDEFAEETIAVGGP